MTKNSSKNVEPRRRRDKATDAAASNLLGVLLRTSYFVWRLRLVVVATPPETVIVLGESGIVRAPVLDFTSTFTTRPPLAVLIRLTVPTVLPLASTTVMPLVSPAMGPPTTVVPLSTLWLFACAIPVADA
jgi:hypothetical protein